MVYYIYLFLIFTFISVIKFDTTVNFFKNTIIAKFFPLIYYLMRDILKSRIIRHIILLIAKTMFNVGNGALFFSMSGLLVDGLGYTEGSIYILLSYGIIGTIGGYIGMVSIKVPKEA